MKTSFYPLLFFFLFIGFSGFSQGSPFTSSSNVVHIGLGLGDPDTYAPSGATPFIGVSYDRGIIDDLGIGNLGVGGMVGVKHFWDDNLDGNWQRILIAGRGTYHFNFVNSYNFDFYVGGMLGFFLWSGETEIIGENTNVNSSFGAFAGIHYYFSENFGIYGEAGYGLGFLNGGIAFNF